MGIEIVGIYVRICKFCIDRRVEAYWTDRVSTCRMRSPNRKEPIPTLTEDQEGTQDVFVGIQISELPSRCIQRKFAEEYTSAQTAKPLVQSLVGRLQGQAIPSGGRLIAHKTT
jgi:hypothetical protein